MFVNKCCPAQGPPLQDIRLRHQDFVQELIPAEAKLPICLPSSLNSAQLNFSLLPSCQSCSAAKKSHLGRENSGRHCALRKTGRAAHQLLASKLLPLREREIASFPYTLTLSLTHSLTHIITKFVNKPHSYHYIAIHSPTV